MVVSSADHEKLKAQLGELIDRAVEVDRLYERAHEEREARERAEQQASHWGDEHDGSAHLRRVKSGRSSG